MDERITRRAALCGLGAGGALGLAGCLGGGGEGDGGANNGDSGTNGSNGSTAGSSGGGGSGSGPVTIGVLQPLSGDLQYYGRLALQGILSGFAYKADSDPLTDVSTGPKSLSVGDTDYELLVRDTELSASTAQSLATDLVQDGDVDMLLGCASSAAATQVIDTVTKQAGVPTMIGPAASAGITADSGTCGEMVFRASENTAMDARSGGTFVADQDEVSRVYLFGADYSFGRAVVNNYRGVFEQAGIEIVGEKFVEQGYSEWAGLLDNAQSAGAQGIVAGFTVQTLPALFRTYLTGGYDFRVFGGFATRVTNQIIGETLQDTLGTPLTTQKLRQSNLGPFTTRYHWNQYDNEINNQFVESHTEAYGIVPDLFSSGMFTAASAIVQAVEESGATAGAEIANTLRGMTVADTPKGQGGYTFQEYNNQARSAMTIANPIPTKDEFGESWGAAVMPSTPVATIGADGTTIPSDSEQMNCSL
ncbi:branched-chain amino acid ABC transporter substrate-binding protein [Halobacteriales archaeon QH_8_64_26]|nr:MAG: branched-chain amino acid ABC transporter substrate-binding protein [Halobacteriales archaeon QH_8_64_26]